MHAQALLEVERRVVLMAVMIRPYLRLGNSLPFWYVGRYRYKKINSNRFFFSVGYILLLLRQQLSICWWYELKRYKYLRYWKVKNAKMYGDTRNVTRYFFFLANQQSNWLRSIYVCLYVYFDMIIVQWPVFESERASELWLWDFFLFVFCNPFRFPLPQHI